jgi:hypothetical protein
MSNERPKLVIRKFRKSSFKKTALPGCLQDGAAEQGQWAG